MVPGHGSLVCEFICWHVLLNLARTVESVHTGTMRTNVNLADDARQFAEVYAHAASGFPTFPPKGRILTTEMVLKAQEEDFV